MYRIAAPSLWGAVLTALFFSSSVSAVFLDEFVTAGSGGLDRPRSIAFQGNALLVANGFGDAIVEFDAMTGTFVRNFTPAINQPRDVVIGPDGRLYVGAGGTTDAIWRFDTSSGTQVDVFAVTSAFNPFGVTFGADGNLYVSDIGSSGVFRFNGTSGAFIDTFVASGSGGLAAPRQLIFGPDGNLYISSADTDQVIRYDGTTGAFIDVFAISVDARGLLFGPDGNLYVADFADDAVRRFDGTTGALVDTVVNSGSGGLDGPVGLAFGPDGSLYVSGFNSDNILRYSVVHEPTIVALLFLALLATAYTRRIRAH